MRITLPHVPPLPIIRPFSREASSSALVAAAAGVFVSRSSTSSTPCSRPMPRTSPMMGCLAFISSSFARRYAPVSAALIANLCSSM